MNLTLTIFVLIVGIVLGALLIARINSGISWYLPSLSNARLSKELTTNLVVVEAYSARLQATSELMEMACRKLDKMVEDIEFSRELITTVLETQVTRQFQVICPEIVDRISRDASSYVADRVLQSLDSKVSNLGSEYVLLQDIDDVSFDINLAARNVDPIALKSALTKVIQMELKAANVKIDSDEARAKWFMKSMENQRRFEMFLGRLGEALFQLKWEGTVALKKEKRNVSQSHVRSRTEPSVVTEALEA